MQSKNQIQQLLKAKGIHPKKRLGQHFLTDLNLMRILVDTAQIQKNDIILEAGCGTGSLTEELTGRAGFVFAVEIDKALFEIAKQQLTGHKNLLLTNADILKNKNTINPGLIKKISAAKQKLTGQFMLVANLPYNIASPLMLNLIAGPLVADAMYVTVQKEVADRMTAGAGNKNYGTLSVLLSAVGEVKSQRTLKPSVFWPQPKVNSAIVSFVRKKEKAGKIKNMEMLNKLVKLFMQHKRKTLKACTKFAASYLKDIKNWPALFEKCQINPQSRPDQIAPEQYTAIANCCLEFLK